MQELEGLCIVSIQDRGNGRGYIDVPYNGMSSCHHADVRCHWRRSGLLRVELRDDRLHRVQSNFETFLLAFLSAPSA